MSTLFKSYIPVSYTHLDVYKRQDFVLVISLRISFVRKKNRHWIYLKLACLQCLVCVHATSYAVRCGHINFFVQIILEIIKSNYFSYKKIHTQILLHEFQVFIGPFSNFVFYFHRGSRSKGSRRMKVVGISLLTFMSAISFEQCKTGQICKRHGLL